jgi:hypothetical protein
MLDFGQPDHVEPAIGTPVAAVERQNGWPASQDFLQANQLPILVGHGEVRHRLAHFGRGLTGLNRFKPRNKGIDRRGEVRTLGPHFIGDGLQAPAKRPILVSHRLKHLFKRGDQRMGHRKVPFAALLAQS